MNLERTLHSLQRTWKRLEDETGQDLAEYGLLAALIAVVVIGAITLLGGSLIAVWNAITNALAGLP